MEVVPRATVRPGNDHHRHHQHHHAVFASAPKHVKTPFSTGTLALCASDQAVYDAATPRPARSACRTPAHPLRLCVSPTCTCSRSAAPTTACDSPSSRTGSRREWDTTLRTTAAPAASPAPAHPVAARADDRPSPWHSQRTPPRRRAHRPAPPPPTARSPDAPAPAGRFPSRPLEEAATADRSRPAAETPLYTVRRTPAGAVAPGLDEPSRRRSGTRAVRPRTSTAVPPSYGATVPPGSDHHRHHAASTSALKPSIPPSPQARSCSPSLTRPTTMQRPPDRPLHTSSLHLFAPENPLKPNILRAILRVAP